MERKAKVDRKTEETNIRVEIDIDGSGLAEVDAGIPFIDHMLTLFAAHGFFDLKVKGEGDTEIDDHHTVEDLGICLGSAIDKALGDKTGINRYGACTVPMDEALVNVALDISNRPLLSYRVPFKKWTTGTFDAGLIKEFFRALVNHAGITMHVDLIAGDDTHHVVEAIFKAFARALDHASQFENRLSGNVPSTKGVL